MPTAGRAHARPRRRPAQRIGAALTAILVVTLVLVVCVVAVLGAAEATSPLAASASASGERAASSDVIAATTSATSPPPGHVGLLGDQPLTRKTKQWTRREMLHRVVTLVNRARGHARTCGDERFAAAHRLRRNRLLDRAASSYARQMARRDFFAHIGLDGLDPGERLLAAGFRWRTYGENIAAGYGSARDVVDAWIDSPEHCANLMGRFRNIGIGYAWDDDSQYGGYWVQELASR